MLLQTAIQLIHYLMAGGLIETFLLFVISRHFPHQAHLTFNNAMPMIFI